MTYRPSQRKEPASHADDWLMTYADMITLLLCFFAIFVMMSVARKEPQPQAVLQTHAHVTVPVTALHAPPPKEASAKVPHILEGDLPFYDIERAGAQAGHPAKPPAPQIQVPPAHVVVPMPVVMLPPKPAPVPAPTKAQGDRIVSLQMSSAAFFASASAELSARGKVILQKEAARLKTARYKNYNIVVEGYTDDQPIHTAAFPSNWELSAARAASVVRFLITQGLPADRLRAAGYGDTHPIAPNRDAHGRPIPANQAKNRRVVIRLERIEKGNSIIHRTFN
ncbi:MAG TPA: flagellar motor protein MotB [Alphaproteobacteria bacterium]|nr:flagellar motor protein MotB [Alphaproteobacteria bacterium]